MSETPNPTPWKTCFGDWVRKRIPGKVGTGTLADAQKQLQSWTN